MYILEQDYIYQFNIPRQILYDHASVFHTAAPSEAGRRPSCALGKVTLHDSRSRALSASAGIENALFVEHGKRRKHRNGISSYHSCRWTTLASANIPVVWYFQHGMYSEVVLNVRIMCVAAGEPRARSTARYDSPGHLSPAEGGAGQARTASKRCHDEDLDAHARQGEYRKMHLTF